MKNLIILSAVLLFIGNTVSAQNETGSFTDSRDGKVYKTVKIGDNVWFAQNLNFEIENSWAYDEKEENANIYGRLYTLEAAEKACPAGWHLATEAEWTSLSTLENESITGGKLKTVEYWDAPNTGADNSFGFNAVPGGYKSPEGEFTDLGKIAAYWTSSEKSVNTAWRIFLLYNNSGIMRGMDLKTHAFSVRCVKDK